MDYEEYEEERLREKVRILWTNVRALWIVVFILLLIIIFTNL